MNDEPWIEEVVALDGLDVVLHRPPDADRLIHEEAFDRDEWMPYWAELWPSGTALARALHGRALGGARVLELGCGLGLASIVAALGGARVLATDWSDDALAATRANAARNGTEVETLRVDWREPQALVERAPFDLVIAADVLYEERLVGLVAGLLAALRSPAVVTDPDRAIAAPFAAQARAAFRVQTRREPGPPPINLHWLTPR